MRVPFSRRHVLGLLAGAAACAAAPSSIAGDSRIARLIAEARGHGGLPQRLDFISQALIGTHYRGYTLIGGPRQPERFVVRDAAFDCVTYCETVLAAALAHDFGEFEQTLRAIRYHNGVVSWRERNHYFFEWGRHNVENKTCRAVAMDGAVELQKSVYWHRELGRRRFQMAAIPSATFLANKGALERGDIVGFVTRRPNLDYFHVGFVAFGKNGELLLRHASQSRRRVVDDRMDTFMAQNRVRYVTLWRPQEPHAVA